MMWMDYNINQAGKNFTISGDWPGEVMGYDREGNPGGKSHHLYQPGDIFIVNENGWLVCQNDHLKPGDVLMVNKDKMLIKVAADSLEVEKQDG